MTNDDCHEGKVIVWLGTCRKDKLPGWCFDQWRPVDKNKDNVTDNHWKWLFKIMFTDNDNYQGDGDDDNDQNDDQQ